LAQALAMRSLQELLRQISKVPPKPRARAEACSHWRVQLATPRNDLAEISAALVFEEGWRAWKSVKTLEEAKNEPWNAIDDCTPWNACPCGVSKSGQARGNAQQRRGSVSKPESGDATSRERRVIC